MCPSVTIRDGGSRQTAAIRLVYSLSRSILILTVVLSISALTVSSQTVIISGNVKDNSGKPISSANIAFMQSPSGTVTDSAGNFSLSTNDPLPLSLTISSVGFFTTDIVVEEAVSQLKIVLEKQVITLDEIIVHAPLRVEENIMQSPVSIETMSMKEIKNIASDDYYRELFTKKGVEYMTSSINLHVLNSRGFAHPQNIRYMHLVDGMDMLIPSLSFTYGNTRGPSPLDLYSVELIPGASSAMYGTGAFNGLYATTTKSPFEFQGLSASFKLGVNHIDSNPSLGEPIDPQPMYEAAVRYAKAIGDKFAFKLDFFWMCASDWHANDFSDNNEHLQGDLKVNPAYDGINLYGDDGGFNLGLMRYAQWLIDAIAADQGLDPETVAPFVEALPAQTVNRTGYPEYTLVNYNANNLRLNLGFNYKVTKKTELQYYFRYVEGVSVFTSGTRYAINGTNMAHRVGLQSDNWYILGYTTSEYARDSYIANMTGYAINEAYLDGGSWFGTYAYMMANGMLEANRSATGSAEYDEQFMNEFLNNSDAMSDLHILSRDVCDANRYQPGTEIFNRTRDSINSLLMPDGAGFYNRSRLFHLEGQYNFKKQIKVFDLTVGANWRMYDMRSNGSTYNDSGDNPIHMHEYAVFVQVFKNLFRNHLKLLLSLRYDKNQNFTGQFSPRASAVYTFLQNHNIRVSYQTGLLNPPVVSLYIDMDVVSARAVGTTQEFHDKYRLSDWTYTIQSVDAFSESVANSDPDPSLLVPYTGWEPLKPERVQVLEIGYRGLFGNRLFLDAYYYYNIYHNFQSNVRVRQAQDAEGNPSDPFSNDEVLFGLLGGGAYNTFSWLGNNTEIVRSNGAALGIDYNFYKSYRAGINYTWNKMIDVGDDQLFLDQYNTPEHIVNISFSNMYLTRNLGFAIAWRWQDAFAWDVGIYQNYKVPAFGTLDAQVNYRIPKAKLTLRLGGTNILNERYVTFTGGPTVGAVYYFQLTFDQLMK